MEKRITNLMLLVISVSTILFFNTKSAFCQNDEPVSVDAERYFSAFGEIIRETPEYHTLQRGFDKNEMHLLDTLSNEERAFIESEVDPPAIGVIRDLKQPIVFNLRNIEIPLNGEISTSGGRLSRINDEILVFSTYIKSEKADEIRIFFSEGNFPYGVKVNLFSEDDFAFNQIELSGELDEYGFYTRTTFADYVIIQVVIPAECFEEDLYFSITKVIHVDNIYIPEEIPRSCYQDANCSYANGFAHIDDLRRATAMLYFPKGNGYSQCSGGQLNDLRTKDFQPFLLTANHCFDTQASAAGLEARFYYWSTSCNSGITNPNIILVNGSNLIATNSQTDFTLVLLKEQGGNFYLGWTTGNVSNDATLHSVHHPHGMLQQYSRHTNKTSPSYTCTGVPTSNYHYTVTVGGQTSNGSSGGVVVDANGRVVGQLLGICPDGADHCNYSSYYNMWGRFNASYSDNNLQYWLNNGGASVAMSTNPSTTLGFGTRNVGSSTDLTVTVTNTGTRPNYLNLEAGSISISGSNANQFSIVGATSLYLPPGTSGSFKVRFSPTSAGSKTATLNIPHNADNIASPRTISLSGTGVEICKECPNYDFSLNPGTSWSTTSSSIVAQGCKMYRISVTNGRKYTFKTGCGNGATANFDTQLFLYNESCNQIAFNDDGCENYRSKIEWIANYTGYAYVKVNGWSTQKGSYTMAYKMVDGLIWTGNSSTNWNTAGNWNEDMVPDENINVIIPTNTTRQPYIYTSDAKCNNLTINSGATLTVGGYTLVVNNDMNISGTLAMNNSSGLIYANGDVFWKSGSTANFTANTVFRVYGNWEFQVGSNANLTNGTVWFTGYPNTHSILCKSASSDFNDITLINLPIGSLTFYCHLQILSSSNQTLKINGKIQIPNGATFKNYSTKDLIVKGNIINNGTFECHAGTVILNGTSQSLRMNTGDYFNNLTFNQSGTVTIDNTNSNILEVKKDVVIKSGVFNLQNRIMRVGGDWTNEKGFSAFNAGTGRVIFNGVGHQYVKSSENFNILEANMGAALRVDNVAHTVTCNQYDWTSGGIDVFKGTFTALDLADNGLYGNYYVNPGGTINLHQVASGWIDLNGQLSFNGGGNINIYGGSSSSYWPWARNAEINMNGGVLDFKDQGIYIYNSPTYSFTQNITGGTIRTSKGLYCDRTGFTPAGGTFEFYGSNDASLYMVSGSQLRNVIIDKSSKGGSLSFTGDPVYDQRSGQLLSDGTRANNISMNSNIDILGDLTIATGSLTLNGNELNIKQNCYVSGTLNMTNPSDVLTVGQAFSNWLEFKSGSIANITAGTINIYGWIIPRSGSSFNILPGNTVVIKGDSGGGLSNFESSATYGNVILQKNSGEWSYIDLSAIEPIVVNGSFTISPDNEFYMQNHNLTVNGAFTDASTSKIYMKNYSKKALAGSYSTGEQSTNTATRGGLLTINSDYTIQGLLDIADGNAVLTQGFGINSTGVLKINGGSFINNRADINNWTDIKGSLQLVDGLFELTNNHPYFNSGSSSVISGGAIRTGGAFRAVDPNVFKPTGGVVEITGNNNNGAIYCYNGNYFHNLVINRSSLYSAFMNGEPVTINNDFIVNKGRLNTSSSLVTVSGNVAINSGGHLSVDAGGGLALAASKSVNVNNGGLIEFNGTSGMQSKITRKSSGYYALNVENGGKIAAVHTIFEYMNTNGVNLKSGAIVDPSNAFTSCIFRNGQSGGRLLTINNSQTFALNNAMFPNNSWGSNFNVYKSVNSGVVTFGGHSGGFSGGSYEYDPNNRIHWGGEVAGNVTLQGVDVVNGQDICFDASNTLTVAGGGSTFIVQNGGNVNLIAGHNIRMLGGTYVRSGAYLHAFISNDYCTLPPVMLAVDEESDTYDEIVSEKSAEVFETQTDDLFRVYPNPTNGRVMLEFSEPTSNTIVEVYGLIGERILAKEISGNSLYELDLSSQPQGIYLVKVSNGNSVVLKKIIKK